MSDCARCGAPLRCIQADGPAAPGEQCWCMQLPAVLPVPEPVQQTGAGAAAGDAGCWCPACLQLALDAVTHASR